MRFKNPSFQRLLLFISISLLTFQTSFATHLRAGEITARRVSATSLTYRVTLTTYTDQINGLQANEAQNNVTFYFGLSSNQNISYEVSRKRRVLINSSTMLNVYDTLFTFPAAGRYTISCGIPNRNANTINLPQPSDQISFFVESTIFINSSIGLNSTPVLLNVPIDSAAVGARYIHNPGAFDVDGDSLSYRLTIPKRDLNIASGVGEFIAGYNDPSTLGATPILNEAENGPATFRINPRTGDLIWDAPRRPGQYNVAFIVEEWRKGLDGTFIRIGEIVRDMQIIVVETDNRRPQITVPEEICIEAGETLRFDVRAEDPNQDQNIRITTSGGVYNKDQNGQPLTFIPPKAAKFIGGETTGPSPQTASFEWETNCLHVREQAYDVIFKVEDFPGRFNTQLTDSKSVKIKVLPPRVRGLAGVSIENGVRLNWRPYPQCSAETQLIVYRKESCSGLNPGECTTGMPSAWGYTAIATISSKDTSFLDPTALRGITYSYRIIGKLAISPFDFMESAPSTEACVGSTLPENLPIMTQVTVDKTDANEGQITVKWARPIGLNPRDFAPPYTYRLLRATGIEGTAFTEIASIPTTLGTLNNDTTFVDTKLNTLQNGYRYKIAFYFANNQLLGETPPASSVRLSALANNQQVRLSWLANVPWSNENQIHRVYRASLAEPTQFSLIAEVPVTAVNTFTYLDTGKDNFLADGDQSIILQNEQSYCYYVQTSGMYPQMQALGLLLNNSQQICATPLDDSPPCAPILTIPAIDCEQVDTESYCDPAFFTNTLRWTNPASTASGQNCRQDIVRYNVYYSRFENGEFAQIGSVTATSGVNTFRHVRNNRVGFAGCYYITAVNSLGVEGTASNAICLDNCPNISFPNVFSPNGDGVNDTFSPMRCPAFIQSISIEVFNRNGGKVYESTGESLAWDGKTVDGRELPSGSYYYSIRVIFERLSENVEPLTFKGWIELIK